MFATSSSSCKISKPYPIGDKPYVGIELKISETPHYPVGPDKRSEIYFPFISGVSIMVKKYLTNCFCGNVFPYICIGNTDLLLNKEGNLLLLTVTDQTEILVKEQPAIFGDLRIGDKVKAMYDSSTKEALQLMIER